jgi:membrane protein
MTMEEDGSPSDPPDPPDLPEQSKHTMRERAEGLRERAEDVQHRARRAFQQAEEARGRSVAIDVIFRAGERDRDAGGSLIAAALAFRFFLFTLPAMLVATLILAIFLGNEGATEFFAGRGISGVVSNSLSAVLATGVLSRMITLIGATIATAWTGWTLAKALNQSSRFAWGLPFRPLRRPLATTAWCVGLLISSLLLLAVINVVHGHVGLLQEILLAAFSWVILSAAWLLVLLRLARPDEIPWTALIPGAAAFGLAVELMQLVTWVWVGFRASAAATTYGDLGTAVALLAWLAILGRVAIGSSVINATLWDKSHPG